MTLKERIESFSELGEILRGSLAGTNTTFSSPLNDLLTSQQLNNPWFTPPNVRLALEAISRELTYSNLAKWTGSYPELDGKRDPSRVGVIMAGNIPLAGFHDFLCVLISGNSILARTSSKDPDLIRFIGGILASINQGFKERITFTEDPLAGFDAVIATGSDNSSRYFEYYFGKYPHIIRKNRNSLAILGGNETSGQLESLGQDVFSYFGLGCRSISKIWIPEGYDLSRLTESWKQYEGIINHGKYAANYDFSKAVYMVNKERFTDTGYLLLRENAALSSPVAVLHYQYYNDHDTAEAESDLLKEKIQCVTGRNHIPFGEAQFPHLWDYADGIDTLDFLLKKNHPGTS